MPKHPKIILHNDETAHFAEQLRARFPEVEYRECNSYEALPELLDAFRPNIVYTVRFNGTPTYPRNALFTEHGPKWIANGGAGTDHFGVWDPKTVLVTNTAGVAADMMAEYVMGGFLHFTLDVPGLLADKAERAWNARKVVPLKGKTLLIVGLGRTGQALALRAKAFGMTVKGCRARPEPMENVDEVRAAAELPDLVAEADFIAISTPLTDKTRGLISADLLSNVKSGAVLADVSRGGVVDQTALLDALRSGHVAGAVLDVFETEPLPADHPFWDDENVLISPHCSSVFEGWEMASFDLFLANLQRWMDGKPLQNVVDPIRGY